MLPVPTASDASHARRWLPSLRASPDPMKRTGAAGSVEAHRLEAAAVTLARLDPVMAHMVDVAGVPDFRRGRARSGAFAELARAVCYQQLAGAAAHAIHDRFRALFDGEPTPEQVVSLPEQALRAAGLSGAKSATIRDLAAKVVSGEVLLDRAEDCSDEAVVVELTQIRGIGRWTAEMFLIFTLGRLDVWPVGDFGVRKGYAMLYQLDSPPTPAELEPLGERFRPYRSAAAWYCRRAVDTVLREETR